MSEILPPEITSEFFNYDEETGNLFWKPRGREWFNHDKYHYTWNKRFAGKIAGRTKSNGYKEVAIFNRLYQQHRIVWAIFNGEWPEEEIDHINGNPSDNRIENLRPVNKLQNLKNINKSENLCGLIGASKRGSKYVARITDNYKKLVIGVFDTPEEAHAAYRAKAKELFDKYANFGS